MQSKAERHGTGPTVAHSLVNKLSTIIGNCDLLIEKTQQGTEAAQRLAVIRDAAKTAADELTAQQQQKLEAKRQRTERRKAS